MSEAFNFQTMIMALEKYWAEQGCLIWQPYYTQVGAGTMNPATFLRVLGPEPWRVGYVEPSVRPDDGRYGDNPNRLQTHYQYQVILKPDPGNPQELYLGSLEAIGINPAEHDIRFVEDNWVSPALGAWGLGWEVWLDGLEITQFTYFQQAGGLALDPVSVEITYGLDRIAAPLQGVRGFQNIQWNETRTFGDVNLQAEQEHSKYYFEVADVARLHEIFGLYEAEAENALKAGLVLPAHDYVLKCSHAFNVLDTRGAIGVTERQGYFRRMRGLAGRVAELYCEQRQRLEYPWLEDEEGAAGGTKAGSKAAKGKRKVAALGGPADFILETGTEELPVGDLTDALAQLKAEVPALLGRLRLAHKGVEVLGTPRRLVVHVNALAPQQDDREELVKGPPAQRAFGADGTPTKAAEGFARGKGVAVEDLEVREMDGGRYAVALVKEVGHPAGEVLAEALPELVANLHFERPMRWNSSNVPFSRPIRWLLALHGDQVIPFEYAGLASGDHTRGLRFSQPESIALDSPKAYFKALKAQGIILDVEARQKAIWEQVGALAAEVKGEVKEDAALLAEVANLVEAPTALRGAFDKAHLELPREVLVAVMKKHQRYFPVEKGGKLLPYFITVRNGGVKHLDIIAKGNEEVIQARFEDAAYFIKEDLKRPLDAYIDELHTLTFQEDLGSYGAKTVRIRALVELLGPAVGLDKAEGAVAAKAAALCKADLATKMVVEMTSLQGEMGRYYALAAGEPEEVATAIYEHYLPRYSGDASPESKLGLVIGLADRLDSLAGLFSVGLAPSGNKDPFALRRTALGLVQNLIAWELDFDLREGLSWAGSRLPVKTSPDKLEDCLTFIVERQRNMLLEDGYRYDVVDAVLAEQGHNPAGAAKAVKALQAWVERKDWETILPAYARCVRITRDLDERYKVAAKTFVEEAEVALYAALEKAEGTERAPGSVDDFLNAFTPMIPAIDRFFDDVLVMTEDEKLQKNRLGLLQRIAALAEGVADLSKLEGF